MRRSLSAALFLAALAVACSKPKSDGKDKEQKSSAKDGRSKHATADDDDDDDVAVKGKKAQSTGKEAAVAKPKALSKKEAKEAVDEILAEAKKASPDCHKIVEALSARIPIAYPKKGDEDAEKPLYVMAQCASRAKMWRSLKVATLELMSLDAKFAHPAWLPLSETGLGNYKAVFEDIKTLGKKYPEDPELAFTYGIATNNLAQNDPTYWADTLKAGDVTVRLAVASKNPEHKPYAWLGEVLRYEANLHLGAFDKAESGIGALEKAGAPAKTVEEARKQIVPVKAHKVLVDVKPVSEIYLGVYHLMGKSKAVSHVAELTVYNFSDTDREFKIEVEIPGVTDRTTKSITVLKGKGEPVKITPPLKSGFDVTAQRAGRKVNVELKVSDGDKVVYEQSLESDLQPRDSLPLAIRQGKDTLVPTNEFIGAWITPNATAVDKFLKKAKKRLPEGASFAGEQAATVPQVKAIYEELKARGYSYVMDPPIVAEVSMSQRTRLPSEVLESTNAQCIEGAILFATLLEAIGVRPVVVRKPGHAFVGWHITAKDGGKAGDVVFLETTAVHDASFKDAMSIAEKEIAGERAAKHFENGLSWMLEVEAMRNAGITPQPYE